MSQGFLWVGRGTRTSSRAERGTDPIPTQIGDFARLHSRPNLSNHRVSVFLSPPAHAEQGRGSAARNRNTPQHSSSSLRFPTFAELGCCRSCGAGAALEGWEGTNPSWKFLTELSGVQAGGRCEGSQGEVP